MIIITNHYKSEIDAFCTLISSKSSIQNPSQTDKEEIHLSIDKLINEVLASCVNSILDGSYVMHDNFINELNNFEIELMNSRNKVMNEFSNTNLEYLYSIDWITQLIEAISTFQRFVENVKLKFKFVENRFFVNESLYNKFSKLVFKRKDHYLVNLFYANLFVAQCDHFVSNTDTKYLRKLDGIIDFLNSNPDTGTESIRNKSYSKAYFLRHKITLRHVEEFKAKDPLSRIYVSNNGKNEVFNPQNVLTENYLKDFVDWNTYLLTHYELFSDWESKIKNDSSPVQNLNNIKILELHKLIKYAKDVVKNGNLLKKIREQLKLRLTNSTSELDIYAAKVCLSYCYNNEFSFLVQSANPNDIEIHTLFDEITNCPELVEIKNYFVPALMLTYKTRCLKKYFGGKTVIQNIDKCKELIDECDELITTYYHGINWVKTNYNYIFQLPTDECFVSTANEEKIFVFSSCFLPISRNLLEVRFKRDLENIRIYKASIENLLMTNDQLKQITELTKNFENAKKEFDRKETKALETIVLVSAILAFVAGSIPGFKFVNSGIEAISFTLALGTSLTWFVLLFYIINRGIEYSKKLKGYFILGAIVMLISWIFVYLISPSKNSNDSDRKNCTSTNFKEDENQKNNSNQVVQQRSKILKHDSLINLR